MKPVWGNFISLFRCKTPKSFTGLLTQWIKVYKSAYYKEIQYIILIFHFAVQMSLELLKVTVYYWDTMTAEPAHNGNYFSLAYFWACYNQHHTFITLVMYSALKKYWTLGKYEKRVLQKKKKKKRLNK